MFTGSLLPLSVRTALHVVISPHLRSQIRRNITGLTFSLVTVLSTSGWAQAPQFTAADVVNAASYAQPISPGSVIAIFGNNLASKTEAAQEGPLPTVLGGTSVTINGVKAPLFYVSPRQINLQAPSSVPTVLGMYSLTTVVVTTISGSSSPIQVPVYATGPGIFSLDASGCGRAVALNVAPDRSLSLNSPSNSAAPGDSVIIYGSGFGAPLSPPPDGTAVAGPDVLMTAGGVVLDGGLLPNYEYGGLAPELVGVDEMKFQIPPTTREGCAVPVAVWTDLASPTLSISIHSRRGQCADPPIESYGQVLLTKTVSSGTADDGETDTLSATFPSGPGVKPPATPAPNPASYVANDFAVIPVSRACPVAGYENLSAGAIKVEASQSGVAMTIQPAAETGGVVYQGSLPTGFIGAGAYTISGPGGLVKFEGKMEIPSPIQIQTPFPAGAVIQSGNALTINWTGGVSGMLVKTTVVSTYGFTSHFDYGYTDASSNSFTFTPFCSGGGGPQGGFCTLGLPTSSQAQIIVELSPGSPVQAEAQGVGDGVQLSWKYRFVFNGLVLQ